jgi:hypothetical protein
MVFGGIWWCARMGMNVVLVCQVGKVVAWPVCLVCLCRYYMNVWYVYKFLGFKAHAVGDYVEFGAREGEDDGHIMVDFKFLALESSYMCHNAA